MVSRSDDYRPVRMSLYDRLIAPAVADLAQALQHVLIDNTPYGAQVLDVGCGGGQIPLQIAISRPDLRVTGIDLAAGQVQRAHARFMRARRESAPDAGKSLHFAHASALSLPFAAAQFDLVYSIASIKHWPQPAHGLAECVRVLRPGGRLVVVEVDGDCTPEQARAFVAQWRLPDILKPAARRFFLNRVAPRSFGQEQLRAMFTALNLSQWQVSSVPDGPAWLAQAIR